MNKLVAHPPRHRTTSAALVAVLGGPALAWAGHLSLGYALVSLGCDRVSAGGADTSTLRAGLLGLSIAGAVLVVVSGAVAVGLAVKWTSGDDQVSQDPNGRLRFLLSLGALLSGLVLVYMVMAAVMSTGAEICLP